MRTLLTLLSLTFLSSCSTPPNYRISSDEGQKETKKEIQWSPNKAFWVGKHEESLALHPIFATMPVESRKTPGGVETRRYSQGGAVTASKACEGNHCAGVSDSNACNHIFYIKGAHVTNYHRVGACGSENLDLRPLDKNGTPEYSDSEIKQAQEIERERSISSVNENKPKECLTREDCTGGMTCKISEAGQKGTCAQHGIFGKLFNK